MGVRVECSWAVTYSGLVLLSDATDNRFILVSNHQLFLPLMTDDRKKNL